MYIHVYIYIYIYTYRERERLTNICVIYICISIYIYICLGRAWMEPAKRPRNMIGRGITKGTFCCVVMFLVRCSYAYSYVCVCVS